MQKYFLPILLLLIACSANEAPIDYAAEHTPPSLAQDYEKADYLWGFADTKGRLLLAASYDEVRNFGPEGKALVRKDGQWYFLSLPISAQQNLDTLDLARLLIASPATAAMTVVKTGKNAGARVVSLRKAYPLAWPYAAGLARVQGPNDSIGFINTQEEWQIPPRYNEASDFENGYAWVRIGEQYGLIDTSGQLQTPLIYEKLSGGQGGEYLFRQNNRYGILSVSGKTILPAQYDKLKAFSPEGLAAAKKDKQWGYLNRAGKWIIPPTFLEAASFQEGSAVVRHPDGQAALIDPNGRALVAAGQYSQLWYAQEGRWIVEKGGKYGAVAADGSLVIPLLYDELQTASEGFMAYRQGEKWGHLASKDGAILTPAAYVLVWPFRNGLARVAGNNGYTLLDSSGRQVFRNTQFIDMRDGSYGLLPVQLYEP